MPYSEGQTATGPNGQRLVYRGGHWVSPDAVQLPTKPGYQYEGQTAAANAQRATNEANASNVSPAQAAATLEATRLSNQEKRQMIDANAAPAVITKAQADATKTQAEAEHPFLDPKVRQQALAQWGAALQIDSALKDMRDKFSAGPGKTHGVLGLMDYLPTPANKNFDTSASQVQGVVRNALGLTGGESNTLGEQKLNLGPYTPDSGKYDSTNESIFQHLEMLRDKAKHQAIQTLGGIPDANGNIIPIAPAGQQNSQNGRFGVPPALTMMGSQGGGNPPGSGGGPGPVIYDPSGGGDARTLATGKFETKDNPALKGVNAQIAAMMRNGASDSEILQFMTSKGVDPSRGNINEVLGWRAKNPTYKGGYNVNVDDMQVLMSGLKQFTNQAWQTPAGTALAHEVSGVLNPALELTGLKPQGWDTDLAALAQQSPIAATVGDIGGMAAGAYGSGKLLEGGAALAPRLAGLLAKAPKLALPMAGDTAFGAATGAANSPGDRWTGAGEGAFSALVGDVAGAGLTHGIGRAIAPTGGDMVNAYNLGIRPTIGQRFAGKGPIGKGVNVAEQAAQSIPFAGSMVAAARQAPRDAWETAGLNQALNQIGQQLPPDAPYGGKAFTFARKAFNDAYDQARSGMVMVPDGQFTQDFGDFQRNVMNGGMLDAASIKQLDQTITNVVGSRMRNGALTGDSYKIAVSDLGKRISKAGSNMPLREALTDFRSIVDDAARRSSPPDAVALMDAADKGYTLYKPLKDAARMAGSEPGRFTPSALNSVLRNGQGKTNSYIEGTGPLADYARVGDQLRDTLPNSGSGERLMTGQLLGGGLGGGALAASLVSPATAAKMVGITGMYAPGVRRAVALALAPRTNQGLNDVGQFITRRKRFGGLIGSAGGVSSAGLLSYHGQ